MIRCRRSSRSMLTPVKGSMRRAGTVCSTTRVLRLISECVACKMNHVTAAVFIPVPIIDTRFAMKINLSPRCRSNSRMVLLDRVIDLPTTRLTGVLLGKRWRAPARHLSGPSGSELEARPLTSPEAYRHGCDERFSSVSGHQVLHIRVKHSYR